MRGSNGNILSHIPHVCYFSYHPWIVASEGRRLTTQEHQDPCLILLVTPPPPLCKSHKKPEVDKKIQACGTLTLTESFAIST